MAVAVMRIAWLAPKGIKFAVTVSMTMVMPVMGVIVMMMRVSRMSDAGNRLERGAHRFNRNAQPIQKDLQRGIRKNKELVAADGNKGMAAAEVPAQLTKLLGALRADRKQVLRGGLDLHRSPVVQHQNVVGPKLGGVRKIHQDLASAMQRNHPSTDAPLIMLEKQAIEGFGVCCRSGCHMGSGPRQLREVGVEGKLHRSVSLFGLGNCSSRRRQRRRTAS